MKINKKKSLHNEWNPSNRIDIYLEAIRNRFGSDLGLIMELIPETDFRGDSRTDFESITNQF